MNCIIVKSMFDPLNIIAFIGTDECIYQFQQFENTINIQNANCTNLSHSTNIFLGYSSELELWVRAKSISRQDSNNNEIEIAMIDYGITEIVDHSNILPLDIDYQILKCPLPYRQCKLKNIELTDRYFNENGFDFVKEAIFNKKLKCIYEVVDNIYEVTIYMSYNGVSMPFQEILIKNRFAKALDTTNKMAIDYVIPKKFNHYISTNESKFKQETQDDILAKLISTLKSSKVQQNDDDFEKNYYLKNAEIFDKLEEFDPKKEFNFQNDIKNALREHCGSRDENSSSYNNRFIRSNCTWNQNNLDTLRNNSYDNLKLNLVDKKDFNQVIKSSSSSPLISSNNKKFGFESPSSPKDFYDDANSDNCSSSSGFNRSNGSDLVDFCRLEEKIDSSELCNNVGSSDFGLLGSFSRINDSKSDFLITTTTAFDIHFPPLSDTVKSSQYSNQRNNVDTKKNAKLIYNQMYRTSTNVMFVDKKCR